MTIIIDDVAIRETLAICRWNDRTAEEWNVDLSAVGMTSECQADTIWNLGEDIRFVGKENDGSVVSYLRQGAGKIVHTVKATASVRYRQLIAQACEPKRGAVGMVETLRPILQHGHAMTFQRVADSRRIAPPVMISKDSADAKSGP